MYAPDRLDAGQQLSYPRLKAYNVYFSILYRVAAGLLHAVLIGNQQRVVQQNCIISSHIAIGTRSFKQATGIPVQFSIIISVLAVSYESTKWFL